MLTMMLEKLPDMFFSEDHVRATLRNYSKSGKLKTFERLMPSFLDQLADLDSPTDVWLVRDILYNEGKGMLKKDDILSQVESVLSDTFVMDVYFELKGKKTALEFTKNMFAIDAEIRCAQLIKKVGAENIKKCTTPEDVSCTYNEIHLGFQVKFKSNEDFTQEVIEAAIIGEMYKDNSDVLRDYSHFSVNKCTKVKEGFLVDSVSYIHSHLSHHLQQKYGSHISNRINVNVTQNDGKLYLDIIGKEKYKGSILSISFRQNPSHMLGGAKAAWMNQEPEKQLWNLLEKKIKEIPPSPRLVGWIDLGMSFQYESYLSNQQAKIVAFLEKYPIPLILRIKVRFDDNPDTILSNKRALEFPLVKKLVSS